MTSTAADRFGLVGSRLDGKYDIEAFVAEGGYAAVYRATHAALRKTVAVKVLKVPAEVEGQARAAFLERFAQEARTIAALDHPAIVQVLDFGTSPMPTGEASPWMVLEWIDGPTLDDDLEARRGAGGRDPPQCLALLRPVFDALAYAHEAGIAHRDVKPANVMLATSRHGERAARLVDFGIAKVMRGDERPASGLTATQTQLRSFSLYYAAPEQLAGTRTGPWTDVYALALVLTEVLTDAPPYDGEEASDIFVDALSPRRPTPAKRGLDVGPWEPVLARAVSLKASDRYADARSFLAALEASVPARATPAGAAATAVARPRRALGPGLAAMALFAALGAAAGYGFLALRARPTAVEVTPARARPTPAAPVIEAPVVEAPIVEAPAPTPAAPREEPVARVAAPADVGAPRAPRVVVRRPPAPRPSRPAVVLPAARPPRATGHEIIPAE